MALSDVLDEVKTRKYFYRNFYRKIVVWVLGGMIVLGVIVVGIIYEALTRPEPLYYATSSDGLVAPVNPIAPPTQISSEPIEQY